MSDSAVSDPAPSDPAASDPAPSDPAVSDPAPSDPAPSERAASQPAGTAAPVSEVNDGRDGPPVLDTLSRILLAAGAVLLLPRQFASAAIAFSLGIALRWTLRRSQPAKATSPDPANEPASDPQ